MLELASWLVGWLAGWLVGHSVLAALGLFDARSRLRRLNISDILRRWIVFVGVRWYSWSDSRKGLVGRAEDFGETTPSRYVVGIDLGTTNSAVCYVDSEASPTSSSRIQVFPLTQWVAAGQFESRESLPSFHFQPPSVAGQPSRPTLPWETRAPNYVVGAMARDEGILAPGRLIASAKSWLCHHGVDRTAELLPWQGAEDVDRLSPIDASARYLQHIRQAWDHQFPDHPLEHQDVVLTLPASFDEVARELTVKAAAAAGLPRVVLIEEPQAAFYAWVDRQGDARHRQVKPGQKILVCDIGGGTSDFTLIRVRRPDSDGPHSTKEESDVAGNRARVQFHRIAVGDHVILGGDNLDLALARFLENRLEKDGTSLEPRQWDVLVRACRQAKETLLGPDPPSKMTVNLPGSGRKLIGGGLQIDVTSDEARQVLVDGFFPIVGLGENPERHQSGFQEFGLPYASDPAISRHIASFLTSHRFADGSPEELSEDELGHDAARPDLILFNGGVFHSTAIRDRMVDIVADWFRTDTEPGWSPLLLENNRLDLAVAHGAAYYGMVRRGEGVRIAAGLARTYYLEVGDQTSASARTAICVVPGSAQPGDKIDLPDVHFDLVVSEPVEFPLLVSSTRLTDNPGHAIPVDLDQMRPLPPLRTALRTQRRNQRGTVPVRLHAQLSEIGTIELWCSQIEGDRQWRLQFDVRSATETDREVKASTGESEGVFDESLWDECLMTLHAAFGEKPSVKPGKLNYRLAEALDMPRDEWPMSLLRRIWEALIGLNEGRKHSPAYEARWLNLLGYSLRPGFGMAVDDWRVTETWRLVQGKLVHAAPVSRNESWVLWRRISAGLPAGQQRALAEPLLAATRALHRRMVAGHVKGDAHFTIVEFAELWRLLGSLELLSNSDKTQLGKMLIELLPKRKIEPVRGAIIWTLGRLGNRVPLYGPLNTVIDSATVAKWIGPLCNTDCEDSIRSFALMQIARRTDDRYRDVKPGMRDKVADWLRQNAAAEHRIKLVEEGGKLDSEEQQTAFGEALPKGLTLTG